MIDCYLGNLSSSEKKTWKKKAWTKVQAWTGFKPMQLLKLPKIIALTAYTATVVKLQRACFRLYGYKSNVCTICIKLLKCKCIFCLGIKIAPTTCKHYFGLRWFTTVYGCHQMLSIIWSLVLIVREQLKTIIQDNGCMLFYHALYWLKTS